MKTRDVLLATAAALACANTGQARSLSSSGVNTPHVDTPYPSLTPPGDMTPQRRRRSGGRRSGRKVVPPAAATTSHDADDEADALADSLDDKKLSAEFDEEIARRQRDDEEFDYGELERRSDGPTEDFQQLGDGDPYKYNYDGIMVEYDQPASSSETPIARRRALMGDSEPEETATVEEKAYIDDDADTGEQWVDIDDDNDDQTESIGGRRRGLFRSLRKSFRDIGLRQKCGVGMEKLIKEIMLRDVELNQFKIQASMQGVQTGLVRKMGRGGAHRAMGAHINMYNVAEKEYELRKPHMEEKAEERAVKILKDNHCSIPPYIFQMGMMGMGRMHIGMGGMPLGVASPMMGVHGAGVHGAGVYGAGVHGVGVHGAGVHSVGVHGAGVYGAGVHGVGVHGAGVYGTGVHGVGVHGAGVYGAHRGARIDPITGQLKSSASATSAATGSLTIALAAMALGTAGN